MRIATGKKQKRSCLCTHLDQHRESETQNTGINGKPPLVVHHDRNKASDGVKDEDESIAAEPKPPRGGQVAEECPSVSLRTLLRREKGQRQSLTANPRVLRNATHVVGRKELRLVVSLRFIGSDGGQSTQRFVENGKHRAACHAFNPFELSRGPNKYPPNSNETQ